MNLLAKFLKSKISFVVYLIVLMLMFDPNFFRDVVRISYDKYEKSIGLSEKYFEAENEKTHEYGKMLLQKEYDYNFSTNSINKSMKAVYRNGKETCLVRSDKSVRPYEYEANILKDKIIYYNTKNVQRGMDDECFGIFCLKSEIQIYNINTQKVEKTVDVLAEIKKMIDNTDFQSDVRKKLAESAQKNKDGILVKGEFQNPIICADKSGKRIMVFEIPKQLDCKTIDSFEYFAYYIDEDQMKKISFDELSDRIKDSGTKKVNVSDINKKMEYKNIGVQSALKNETQERNSYCLKNYMDRASFETLLDSNKIKYRATYLSDVAKTPVHIKMLGSDLDKSSKLAKKFPELAKKYASDDYVIDWYAGDEKNSDEIAKQLLPKGKKLNYDTVHVGDDCAKNLKNASVDSLKDYYKKVKPECILEGRKK